MISRSHTYTLVNDIQKQNFAFTLRSNSNFPLTDHVLLKLKVIFCTITSLYLCVKYKLVSNLNMSFPKINFE